MEVDKINLFCYTTNEYLGTPCLIFKAECPEGGVNMRKYEVMFIVKPDLEETEIAKIAEEMKKVLTDKAAKVLEEKKMGQRELAYEMNKYKTGYYYLYVIEANTEAINEFDRIARINENVIRHLVIRVED